MSEPAAYSPTSPACPGCRERDQRIAQLERDVAQLHHRLDQQDQRIAQLLGQLEEARRSGKRQAAPFSKGPPKQDPKTPGRKPGDKYGKHARRGVPPRIDEVYAAPLPPQCPHCDHDVSGTAVGTDDKGDKGFEDVAVHPQYQAEIPRRPIFRRFDVSVGRCPCCGKLVQGRHPLQTSNALGAASSQLGPEAQAAVVMLNKELGLSHGKIARFFQTFFGLSLSRGGSCRIMLRAGDRLEGDYNAIIQSVQTSTSHDMVVSDETGWRIGGRLAWMHVAVAGMAVAYLIDQERGIEAIVKLLGAAFAGILVHDGFASYDQFKGLHQTCLAHLLRRCVEMLETAKGMAAVFPRTIKGLLQESLEVRDQRDAGELLPATAARKAGQFKQRMLGLVTRRKTHVANRRLAKHLNKHIDQIFTFLRRQGVDATNYKAEQAIRPAVVNRKVWGGNRTAAGAKAQAILMSVLGTCRKTKREALEYVSSVLCNPATTPLLPAPSG